MATNRPPPGHHHPLGHGRIGAVEATDTDGALLDVLVVRPELLTVRACPDADRGRAHPVGDGLWSPLHPAQRRRTVRGMTEIVQTRRPAGAPPTAHAEAGPAAPAAAGARLNVPSRWLANAARALRGAAETAREAPDLVLALAELDRALADVAAGAELAAYEVIERDRTAGASATHVSPTRAARALSWRLHALSSALRAASHACAAAQRASRHVSRARVVGASDGPR